MLFPLWPDLQRPAFLVGDEEAMVGWCAILQESLQSGEAESPTLVTNSTPVVTSRPSGSRRSRTSKS